MIPSSATRNLQEFRAIMAEWSESLLKQNSEDSRKGIERSDLLSIIVETNEYKGRLLTESEMKDQIPGMLVAGQDTTGTTIAFALYELAKRSEWQEQVRAEIRENGECVTTGDYDKLSLLNAQLKETLRCYPALPNLPREALKDTVLPLSEPIMTIDGRKVTEIPIRKGDVVFGGLASYNRCTSIWGDDADIFDPIRWVDGRSSTVTTALGPYSNLASFIGGARACLGWRLG
ncbi:cytochrome P450 [Marasmius fiardii PR-910]|nr:cytochrome P450 [Marasmius fiardii PR-910]